MFRPLTRSHRRRPRRGTSFLLIVVIMTSIMAAVGVAYALFAMQVGKSSDLKKQGEGGGTSTALQAPNPVNTINQFFGVLIYDTDDDSTAALTNALRGHSLAASMFGRLTTGNTVPYAGVGTFHEDSSAYTFGTTAYGLTGDRAVLINHTLGTLNGAPFLLDPEWTNSRAMGGAWPASFSASQTGRSYVGKHVGYSYPDLAHLYEAQVDPATGEVRVPSFHRPWAFGTLAPSNANWTNAQGRLLTLRPRPAEHPQFPYVPMDASGGYNGDVQNWPGGCDANGFAKNDSIWLNLNLPVVPMGKIMVQPLVAALIVPINGRFNGSVHGNTFGTSNAHISYAGYGPHEVNIAPGLAVPTTVSSSANANETDRQAMIGISNGGVWSGRGQPTQRNGVVTSRAYDPYTANTPNVPNSAPVAWNAAVTYPSYPLNNSIVGLPTFTGFQSGNTTTANHPVLFNPTEWPSGGAAGSNRTYMVSDNRRLSMRTGFTPDWYGQTDLITTPPAQNSLGATPNVPAYAFPYATGQTTTNGYRLDPVIANRGLFTTRSYEIDRPKVVPNFVNRDGANGLALSPTSPNSTSPNPFIINKPGSVSPGQYPTPQTLGPVTDFAASNQWVNAMAALGSVNINRPLADYRVDPTKPLSSPGNVTATSAATADADRQQLARDIFVRLASATGAGAIINLTAGATAGTYTISTNIAVGTPQYGALQYLAQVAVNIVDYIDNDDISTVFVWNPNTAAANPVDFTNPTDIDNRVVFGVERTRLVINEAYSEVANDPATTAPTVLNPLPANANAHVRFWLELLNPTATPGANSPINDGSVPLNAYRIEIARANRTTMPTNPAPPANQTGDLVTYLSNPANTTGRFAVNQAGTFTPATPDILYPLTGNATTVGPNNGVYAPAAGPANGIELVGPQLTNTASMIEFNPGNAGVWASALFVGGATNPPAAAPGSNSMVYTLPIQADGGFATAEFKRNVVLLRRYANPYLTGGDQTSNPYITVDMMDYVPSFDAVAYSSGATVMRAAFAAGNKGYDPAASRFSVGKVQPYAAHAAAVVTAGSGNYNDYTVSPTVAFPNTMVVNQKATVNGQPNNTFGRHNGTAAAQPAASTFTAGNPPAAPILSDTIMTPFDWMVHMDRPLVNQFELFQVRDTPPHRATDLFIAPPTNATAPGIAYHAGIANWRDTYAGLGRGVEYLTVKPYTTGVAHGGRVPGRIGLNAVQDQRIVQGLFDPQAANGFDTANFVNPVAWSQWMNSRTPVETRTLSDGATQINRSGAASATVYDSSSGTDRPFLPLGVPASDPFAAATAYPFAFGAGSTVDQTILRRPNTTSPPYLYTNANTLPTSGTVTYPATQPNGPSYYQAEPARKILNNSSTVNQQYLVILTIGYFQVVGSVTVATPTTGNPVTIPQLGPEAYVSIPGDARQQVVAVVDMSNMALQPASNAAATSQPFFTSLEQTVRPSNTGTGQLVISYDRYDGNYLYVAADGQEVQIAPATAPMGAPAISATAATQLVVGFGADQQVVNVVSVDGVSTAGFGLVTVSGMTRTAWGGSCVSNVRPGYPGPQPNFQYNSPAYAPLIPYIERVK